MNTTRRQPTLLVVEDNQDAGDSLALLLGLWGYDARVARSGDEALAAVRLCPPHVVLMDLALPGEDGYRIARRLRDVLRPEPRFVAVTGYGSPHFIERSRQERFDRHVLKGADPEELRQLLRELIELPYANGPASRV